MRSRTFRAIAGLAAMAALVVAQPKPKSQKEVEALMAIQNSKTPDARITAVDALIQKFADTEFKAWAYQVAADAARQKQDSPKAIIYAQLALDADPKSFASMLMIAGETARGTRENDLDKEERLGKAEKFAKDAIALLATAPKMNPGMTDEQWEQIRKDYISEGHEDLGMSAMVRKKYDVAITEFKLAVDGASTPDPSTMVRLATAYNQAGKQDEALAVLAKIEATPNLNPIVKQYADAEKKRAEQAKAAKK